MESHQRSKLEAAGLRARFEVVVTSGKVGCSKPDPGIFRAALAAVGCEPADAVMAGDNVLRDVAGAQAAGLRGVWVDREDGDPRGVTPDARLADLAGVLTLGW
jgi:putative hydrolase of the HAD superfamily